MSRVNAAWVLLIVAGVLEIGWPLGLKLSQSSERRVVGVGERWALYARERRAAVDGTAGDSDRDGLCGLDRDRGCGHLPDRDLLLRGPVSLMRVASAGLIVVGVIGLKMA